MGGRCTSGCCSLQVGSGVRRGPCRLQAAISSLLPPQLLRLLSPHYPPNPPPRAAGSPRGSSAPGRCPRPSPRAAPPRHSVALGAPSLPLSRLAVHRGSQQPGALEPRGKRERAEGDLLSVSRRMGHKRCGETRTEHLRLGG